MSSRIQLNDNSLIYVHDPMCSWCWGYRDTLNKLKQQLPKDISVYSVLGGLAPDTDSTMPAEMQIQIRSNWERIQKTIPGIQFNYDFWRQCTPRRSTYLACRAVLAASLFQVQEEMNLSIQQAYYLQARNPSDIDVLLQLAVELGIDDKSFHEKLISDEINQLLEEHIKLSRETGADSFPSLFFYKDKRFYPLVLDYTNHQITLDHLRSLNVDE